MSIDTKDKIDIRSLVIEEPRAETVPPPLNFITKSDWPKIYEELKELRDDGSPEFLYRAYELDLMFPGSVNEFKPSLHTEEVVEFKDFMDNGSDETRIVHVLELVKRLFPQNFQGRLALVNLKDIKEIIDDRLSKQNTVPTWFQEAAAYKALFPTDVLDLDNIKKLLDKHLHSFSPNVADEVRIKGSLRILLGDDYPELKSSEHFVKKHLQHLQEQKNREYVDWSAITEHLFYLSICAAKEIKFTDRGLELVMEPPKSPLDTSIPALPEVKRYGN